ncbi:MAG: flavodoxin family protein [Bacillota bacterium]|nr:flavodoxin family protein [Bacillota bacterium]
MKIVILDGTEQENCYEKILKDMFADDNQFSYFKLKDMSIQPCRSCGACGIKSPGKCIINDEIHPIMKAFAKGEIIVFMTPVRFGGYSSQLKKAIDRFMPLGMPLYMVKGGHLLHPMRYGSKHIIGIGIIEENIPNQEDNFKELVSKNALNMSSTYEVLLLNPQDSVEKAVNELKVLLKEQNRI